MAWQEIGLTGAQFHGLSDFDSLFAEKWFSSVFRGASSQPQSECVGGLRVGANAEAIENRRLLTVG